MTAGTRTFLFSDIEGSTRLEQEIGTGRYAEVRERHRELLRAAFAANGGMEQGTEGDSFFVVFPGARSGLLAAIEAQRALASEAWPEGREVRVRMGLHVGEAELVGGSLVGLDINRAARIAAAANGGQIVVSDAVRSLVSTDLPEGVSLRPLGSHRLKDLRDPELLAQVVAEGLAETFPPLRSVDARPNNLPTQLTSFVGREAELAEAGRLLAASRLVTLTGPGGTGKTRLSLQVAAAAAPAYPDGVFFVPLETVREPALVPSRLLAAIGITEGNRPALDLLKEWLTGRSLLLLLDNLEQVIGVGPIVADLLRTAPDLSVLATSRAPLHISGEQEYQVPGLPTPPDPTASAMDRARLGTAGGALDPATMSTYEAVRLFIARASSVRPGFQVTNENAPAVAAITARLHGMPLPIELAAARVKVLSPDAILKRLEDQLALLAAGSRDLPERQQTLRGAIAWSYDLLADGECRLLDRLSVFRSSFDLEAAEAVAGPASELGIDVLDGLAALADQSLLRTLETGGEPRFVMLETIREFAGEMLATRGEQAEIERRHAAWFLALAQRAQPELAGSDQRMWLERLEADHDNYRVALDRAVAAGDAATAIPLAFSLWRFWQKRGHLYEARRRLDAIAAEPWSTTDPLLHARLLEALGGVAWWQADIKAMATAYREAVELWRGLGDKAELANALYNFSFAFTVPEVAGGVYEDLDPDNEGVHALEEALALYEALGDEHGEANVLWGIGNRHYFARGRHPGAGVDQFRTALEKFRRTGDRTMEAWSLHMLGGALTRTGDVDGAAENLRHALRHFWESGDAAGITLALDDLSSVALARDEPDRAARLWGAARNLTNATGANLASFVDGWIEQDVRPNVRNTVPPEELTRLAREGAAWSLDEAVAYGLGIAVSELAPHAALVP